MKGFSVSSTCKAHWLSTQGNGKRVETLPLLTLSICFVSIALLLMVGCAPPFSSIQSARTVGKGKFEVTPLFSTVFFSAEGETEHVQNEFGFQAAYGLGNMVDLQLRYEFINVSIEDVSASANVIGIGPKVGVYKEMIAFACPIGFAFGGDVEDISETWQLHPTLLFTLPIGNSFEFNPSAKMLIPLSGDGDILLAFNLGAGISTDLRKWAARPEIGFLIDPGEEGHFTQFSVGLTFYP
jgi:hypothetical protein